MYSFKSLDRYILGYEFGRYIVYIVESPVKLDRDTASKHFDMDVEIDGEKYKVLGVESFCKNGPIEVGEKIGLKVENPAAWIEF